MEKLIVGLLSLIISTTVFSSDCPQHEGIYKCDDSIFGETRLEIKRMSANLMQFKEDILNIEGAINILNVYLDGTVASNYDPELEMTTVTTGSCKNGKLLIIRYFEGENVDHSEFSEYEFSLNDSSLTIQERIFENEKHDKEMDETTTCLKTK